MVALRPYAEDHAHVVLSYMEAFSAFTNRLFPTMAVPTNRPPMPMASFKHCRPGKPLQMFCMSFFSMRTL